LKIYSDGVKLFMNRKLTDRGKPQILMAKNVTIAQCMSLFVSHLNSIEVV
jgi:hypothetical protein